MVGMLAVQLTLHLADYTRQQDLGKASHPGLVYHL